MICPICHFNNPIEFAFCGKCGAPLAELETVSKSITDANLTHLRLYLPPPQSEALPPASAWQASDVSATLDQLTQLLDAVITYLPRHLVQTELDHLTEARTSASGEFLD